MHASMGAAFGSSANVDLGPGLAKKTDSLAWVDVCGGKGTEKKEEARSEEPWHRTRATSGNYQATHGMWQKVC